jgi:hypothetical protein
MHQIAMAGSTRQRFPASSTAFISYGGLIGALIHLCQMLKARYDTYYASHYAIAEREFCWLNGADFAHIVARPGDSVTLKRTLPYFIAINFRLLVSASVGLPRHPALSRRFV